MERTESTAVTVAGLAIVTSSLLNGRRLPPQVPRRTRSGDVRLPAVPLPVALEWMAGNPGVTTIDRPGREQT